MPFWASNVDCQNMSSVSWSEWKHRLVKSSSFDFISALLRLDSAIVIEHKKGRTKYVQPYTLSILFVFFVSSPLTPSVSLPLDVFPNSACLMESLYNQIYYISTSFSRHVSTFARIYSYKVQLYLIFFTCCTNIATIFRHFDEIELKLKT